MVRHTWSLMPILRGLDSLTATPPTLIAELTVRRANRPRTRIRGPLTPFVAGVRDGLLAQGYVATTAAQLLMVMVHLSRWMADGGLAIGDLVPSRLGEFAGARRDEGYATHVTVRGLSPVLSALENCGVVFPPALPAVLRAHGKLRASFVEYLAVERGLGAETVGYYGDIAARFLRHRFGDAAPALGELSAVDVVGFVLRAAKEARSTETARHIATGLRAFLRWLSSARRHGARSQRRGAVDRRVANVDDPGRSDVRRSGPCTGRLRPPKGRWAPGLRGAHASGPTRPSARGGGCSNPGRPGLGAWRVVGPRQGQQAGVSAYAVGRG
jgi:hypothetical protein